MLLNVLLFLAVKLYLSVKISHVIYISQY